MRTVFLALLMLVSLTAKAESYLSKLFPVEKPIIAALFLELPKDLSSDEQKQEIIDYGVSQMRILERQGVDACLWEFSLGGIMNPPISSEQLQVMTDIIKAIVDQTSLVIGVEILWHYPYETLLLAKASGAKFVRLDFFSDRMIADGIEVPIDPQGLLEFKELIGADDVILFTDIQVKYATMVNPNITMSQSAGNAISKGSQGVIVSGKKSGHPPSAKRVADAKNGAKKYDVIIGSGFSYKNASALLKHADGIIVGTSISQHTGGPLVESKVKQLMTVIKEYRKN